MRELPVIDDKRLLGALDYIDERFIAEVTEAHVLNDVPSMTYQYYFDHVKPKPAPSAEKKAGWVCKICGYVYEGEELPADYVCPLCKHGPEDFERA